MNRRRLLIFVIFAGLVALAMLFIESLDAEANDPAAAAASDEGDVLRLRVGAAPEDQPDN